MPLTKSNPHYFIIIAMCDNEECSIDEFRVTRKRIKRIGSDGQEYTQLRVVCPECERMGFITEWQEVWHER